RTVPVSPRCAGASHSFPGNKGGLLPESAGQEPLPQPDSLEGRAARVGFPSPDACPSRADASEAIRKQDEERRHHARHPRCDRSRPFSRARCAASRLEEARMTVRLLQVLTPLHLGEGAQVGAVDLPVARERHTDWPFVPGASLKGALRAHACRDGRSDEDIQRVFGADPGEALFRGATSFGDGVLLGVPARTITSTFALLVSPLTLGRFAREVSGAPEIPTPSTAERLLVGSGFDL